MLGITDITAFVIATILIVLLPGPNSLYVLTAAAEQGRRAGASAALGIFLGDCILMLLSTAGLAALLQIHSVLFAALQWAGGVYLLTIGARLLLHLRPKEPQPPFAPFPFALSLSKGWLTKTKGFDKLSPNGVGGLRANGFLRGPWLGALGVSLLNPKAILFFVAFFVPFADPLYPHPTLTFLALAAIVQAVSLTYLGLLIFFAAHWSGALGQHSRPALLARLLAALAFIALGARLLAGA